MSELPLPFLLSTAELENAINEHKLLLVDVGDRNRYEQAHIPGAVHLDYDELIVKKPPAMGLFPDAGQLSRALSAIGLQANSIVVAYDDAGGGKAGRLLYTLDCLGHANWSMLDGGWAAWLADESATESGTVLPVASQYQARLQHPERIYDADRLLAALEAGKAKALDCRTPGEFDGSDVRAARGGHIPGAVNRNWTEAFDSQRENRCLPLAPQQAAYDLLELAHDDHIVLHCQTHHRSAHSYVLLKALGYNNIAAYPGSWSEWGNRDDLPVES